LFYSGFLPVLVKVFHLIYQANPTIPTLGKPFVTICT
jgi:hypothetical protein